MTTFRFFPQPARQIKYDFLYFTDILAVEIRNERWLARQFIDALVLEKFRSLLGQTDAKDHRILLLMAQKMAWRWAVLS
jgi:hypothetical protein